MSHNVQIFLHSTQISMEEMFIRIKLRFGFFIFGMLHLKLFDPKTITTDDTYLYSLLVDKIITYLEDAPSQIIVIR